MALALMPGITDRTIIFIMTKRKIMMTNDFFNYGCRGMTKPIVPKRRGRLADSKSMFILVSLQRIEATLAGTLKDYFLHALFIDQKEIRVKLKKNIIIMSYAMNRC